MSTNNDPPKQESTAVTQTEPQLDVSKLHALPTEQQDLFLLSFVHELHEYATQLSLEALPGQQAAIKKEVIKIVGLSAPAASRVVRQILGRVLADIFSRGSTQLLHETITELLAFVNTGKSDKEFNSRHAAVVCLGLLFKDAGNSAVSLSALTSTTLLKSIKSASSHSGLRASGVRALGHLVRGLGPSLDEQIARDIWRQVRALATSDKSPFVQKSACVCIKILVQETPYFLNSHDFESLKSAIWKTIDSSLAAVRTAAATTLAAGLISAYSEKGSNEAIAIVRKPRKSKKADSAMDDDEDENVPPTPLATKPATQLSLSLGEILRVLSMQYCKASTSNRSRAGLAMCYKFALEGLPDKVVQEHYSVVASHFFNDLIDFPTIANNRYRSLLTRGIVDILLSTIVGLGLLPENGQINAARWLINDVLKNYPRVLQERKEPSKKTLAAALRALSHLLKQLGSASSAFQDSCREALFQVLQHPSYTVQVHVARCLRVFTRACPQQLARSVNQALANIRKDLETINDVKAQRRAIGCAMSIAAILSTARESPLYGSIELFAGCFSFATEQLKNSANSELRLCATQVQVAWVIIGGLTTLGPSFVKVHLNQLLLMWKNASPPPLADNSTKRGQLELSFLTHVRESALTALLNFLLHNSSLVTLDGSKRIAAVLHNALTFLNGLPSTKQSEDLSNRLVPALQLQDYAFMLRRRVFQCVAKLLSLKNIDQQELTAQSNVINLTVQTFLFPDRPATKNLELSLASSASTFEGIWEAGDNWGYGVNSLVSGYMITLPSIGETRKIGGATAIMDHTSDALTYAASCPIPSAFEYDFALSCNQDFDHAASMPTAPATACVSTAIQLFAIALPLQHARVQESCVEQIAGALAQPMPREPGRKCAMQLNAATALLSALAVANGETSFSTGKLAAQITGKMIAEILRTLLLEPDSTLRNAAAQAYGRLCNLCGAQFTTGEVQQLIDMIVANRDPNARAGCALALGQIHSQVGAMAASLHLKTIVGVLLSLCSDSHPVVHFWSLKALADVAESAGLSFSSYASSTLGMLAQLYSGDSHNEETTSLSSASAELEHSTPLAIAECVDSIINVLGPDLQDVAKSRNLILTLISYFQIEDLVSLQVQSLECLGHILMYAPAHVQMTKYVHDLHTALTSRETMLEVIAVSGIENLMKRNAAEVFRVSRPGFEDDLWAHADKAYSSDLLRNMLRSWLQQTCLQEPAEWVSRCQAILSKTRLKKEVQSHAKPKIKSSVPDLADEEVAGLSSAAGIASADPTDAIAEGQDFLRWQTREFAMQLLSEMLSLVQDETTPDHVVPSEAILQKKVADIVRVAFSASTANVVALRLWGLRILDQVLKLFGKTPDPDFLEASLLEQYQAQISSALTPAFAADSNPEVAAVAIEVCATFVATGIVTNVDRMGRIFKVLSTGLDNLIEEKPESSIGDLVDLTNNAQSMLKMALLSGWAHLQLASGDQPYLEDIVHPFVPKLAPLWLSSLQEFAALRFEPEISNSLGGEYASSNLHEKYGAFDREVRLSFFQAGWLAFVDAIAVLVEKDSGAVFDALDNRKASSTNAVANGVDGKGKDMNFREEPVAFFFILFGLAYEALVTQARDSPAQALAILNAVKKILTPAVSGNAIYQDAVFTETTDTLDRLALTSNSETQVVLVEIARNLSIDHIVAKAKDRDDKLSDDIDQLFELTRIIILIMTGLIPTLEDPPGSALRGLTDASTNLVQMCFQALVDVSQVFPAVIRSDLHACIIHCFCTMLATGICQDEVIARIMPIFRTFLSEICSSRKEGGATERFINGALGRMLSILSVAQRRENDYSILCAKNTLLSTTVLLTTSGRVLPGNNEFTRRAVAELLDCLQDVGLAKIAASCIRSLLMVNPKSANDESIARQLWPHCLAFINDAAAEDPEGVKPTIIQALVASVVTLRRDGRQAAISILIPSLLLRASRPSSTIQASSQKGSRLEDPRKGSAARLLELAAADGPAFREAINQLGDAQRTLLEELLRSASTANKRPSLNNFESEDSKPTIELRMDF